MVLIFFPPKYQNLVFKNQNLEFKKSKLWSFKKFKFWFSLPKTELFPQSYISWKAWHKFGINECPIYGGMPRLGLWRQKTTDICVYYIQCTIKAWNIIHLSSHTSWSWYWQKCETWVLMLSHNFFSSSWNNVYNIL